MNVAEMLEQDCRDWYARNKDLQSVLWHHNYERRKIMHRLEESNADFEQDEAFYLRMVRDWTSNQRIKDAEELVLDGHEHPFFTEATLYDLLGKENARSVLAVFKNLCKAADEQ